MTATLPDDEFVASILQIFTMTGRGAAVIGTIESGSIPRGGALVEIWAGDRVIARAVASVEDVRTTDRSPSTIGLLFRGVDEATLRPGDTVRWRPGVPLA